MNLLDGKYEAGPWTHPKSLISREDNVSHGDVRYINIKQYGIDDYYRAKKENGFSNQILWEPMTKQDEPIPTPKKIRGKSKKPKVTSCY